MAHSGAITNEICFNGRRSTDTNVAVMVARTEIAVRINGCLNATGSILVAPPF